MCLPYVRTPSTSDRKRTRLNSSHTEIYTLSLHDALPISVEVPRAVHPEVAAQAVAVGGVGEHVLAVRAHAEHVRSEEDTSELQSHRDLHSFPPRRSSDLGRGATSRPSGSGCSGCCRRRSA